ncbi:MAG: transporter substrate-binding domain-containing protein [Clostridiales bacterium]|nr:transporter substrate-binding domain-containing protein [Clostridiales bacterium]
MKKYFLVFVLLMFFNSFAEREKLQIYVTEMEPLVVLKTSTVKQYVSGELSEIGKEYEYSGCEVDLWEEIAGRIGLSYDYHTVSWNELFSGITTGVADIAFAGITITADRHAVVDFTLPTMNSGLGIMVLKEESGNIINTFIVMVNALKMPVLLFVSFVLFVSVILWWCEKDDDPKNDSNGISDSFFPGIFEAIYFCIVTCSTVGYGDYTPKKWIAKVVVVGLIFAGIIAFCNFTALLAAQHVTDSIHAIKGPEDLKGKTVVTQEGTTSINYLNKIGAKVIMSTDISTACDQLLLKRADAVVYDYPVLKNYEKNNAKKVKLVEGVFDKQYYGFMLQEESELKKQLDTTLLEIYEDGTYDEIIKKWF